MISLILSGGVGSRLWPVSREKLPKQFSDIFGKSLFQQTVQRLTNLGEVQVCTGESLRGLTEKTIREQSLKISKVFYEPMGRNTAPAIALVCKALELEDRINEVLGVFPSDHFIENEKQFSKVLGLAQSCAQNGKIVTIGINPDRPATGFGYVDCKKQVFLEEGELKAFEVNGFKEKPSLEVAQQYLKAGNYYWNSGMFVFQVSTMIEAFEQFMPELWKGLSPLKNDLSNIGEIYSTLPKESIDYGVMEKATNQVNIPCRIGWSDLGSWDDIAEASLTGSMSENSSNSQSGAKGSYIYSASNKKVELLGLDDLIVVDTEDALLVSKKGQSQDVKKIVERLNKEGSELTRTHTYEVRPWGVYRNLWEEENFKSKVISVDAGQQLSYQSHAKRAEIWVVVEGEGEVVLNDEIIKVSPGKVVQIPLGAKHRMRNNGSKPLKFVEVQLGDYFGEDDITRYEDDYKRL